MNRDERWSRKSEKLSWHDDCLFGVDLEAGGTWLGINKRGSFISIKFL